MDHIITPSIKQFVAECEAMGYNMNDVWEYLDTVDDYGTVSELHSNYKKYCDEQ